MTTAPTTPCPPDELLAKIAAQRDAYQSIAKRHCDTISNIADTLEDEGDRVYLGSSNDADDLREVAQAMQSVGWDRHLGNEHDWPNRVRDLTEEISTLRNALVNVAISANDDDGFTSDGHERCVDMATAAYRAPVSA